MNTIKKVKIIRIYILKDTLHSHQETLKGENTCWNFSHLNYYETKTAFYRSVRVKSLVGKDIAPDNEVKEDSDFILWTAVYSD